MDKKRIDVGTPVSGAPYTPGIISGGMIFVSGQGPIDPKSKEVLRSDFEAQVRLSIENVERILKAAGAGLEHCVKVTVYLLDMDNFAIMNRVYAEYFGEIKPARTCIQAARLPLDMDVEIDAIATLQ